MFLVTGHSSEETSQLHSLGGVCCAAHHSLFKNIERVPGTKKLLKTAVSILLMYCTESLSNSGPDPRISAVALLWLDRLHGTPCQRHCGTRVINTDILLSPVEDLSLEQSIRFISTFVTVIYC